MYYIYKCTYTQIIACVFIIDNCKDYKFSKEKQNESRFRYHLMEIFAPAKISERPLGARLTPLTSTALFFTSRERKIASLGNYVL